jgi:serine/threonine-protein kinase
MKAKAPSASMLKRTRPIPNSWVGRTVGKYRVDSALGVGAAGVVYRATDLAAGAEVAIKVLHQTMAGDPVIRGRFDREIRAARELESPHVVRVLDVIEDDGVPAVVLELLRGRDLAQVLEEDDLLPIRVAVGYLIEACEGVAVAHARGIVHRDIKPANLFLAESMDGRITVKVLDFGVSKVSWDDRVHTAGEETLGTPSFMSPEQLESSKTADVRADVWSLGVVAYELLTGRLPFPSKNTAQLCVQIMVEPHPSLKKHRAEIPDALARIIDTCLHKPRDLRYPDAAALRDALVGFLRTPEIVVSAPLPAAAPLDPRLRATFHDLEKTGGRRRGPSPVVLVAAAVAGVALVVVLAAVAVIAFVFLGAPR